MISQLLTNRHCLLEHMKLGDNGFDLAGINLRPLLGLELVDYLFPGFWVWARLIMELGEVGYDANSLEIQSYDWRLSFEDMERRDGYFSQLKQRIEFHVRFHKRKVVVVTHSL